MTDIVWLLRNDVPCGAGVCCAGELCNQAADEIERLRHVLENAQQARVLQGKAIIDAANEIERLQAALREITNRLEEDFAGKKPLRRHELEKARAALEVK